MRRSLARLLPFFAATFSVVLGSSRGQADELVGVPDVAGKTAADAKAALVSAGLTAGVVEVDGAPAGTVAAQVPEEGSFLPRGGVVVIDVRVKGTEGTPAPKAVGLSVADAITAFGSLYDLAFQPVPGAAGDRGRIVAQAPTMGAALRLRGRLTLSFVPDPSLPPRVPVPVTATMSPADAIQTLAAAGLHARVAQVALAGSPPDLVVGQSPLPGTEAARYSTVYVVVTVPSEGAPATPPAGDGNPAQVPNVVGLTESSARAALDEAGFDMTVEWIDGDPADAFLVREQAPAAGETAAQGSAVVVKIVRFSPGTPTPGTPSPEPLLPSQVSVPHLVGLLQSQAEDLLASLGLVANPILEGTNAAPPNRVFAQQVLADTPVAIGTQIVFRVAKPPPPPTALPVPDFYGRTKGTALILASQAGLSISIQEIQTGAHPPHRIYSQSIPPYTVVPLGTTVAVKLARPNLPPAMTAVPDLTGLSGAQAMVKLAAHALAGNQSSVTTNAHPPYKVYWQWPNPGTGVPTGSVVQFKIAKPPLGWNPVPNLIGMTKAQAVFAVQAAGFQPNPTDSFQQPHPVGKVFQQSPNAGEQKPPGTIVSFKVMKLLMSPVPNVVGMTTAQASVALGNAGFVPAVQLTPWAPGPPPPGQVFQQQPLAGAAAQSGSQVTIRVKQGPGPSVQVPNVIGKLKQTAILQLTGLGLQPTVTPVAGPPGPDQGRVIAQNPSAGQNVAVGAFVQLAVRTLQANPPVTVPNLIGKTKAQAQAALALKGLSIDADLIVKNDKPLGLVYAQQPSAGSSVAAGSVVNVRIAKHQAAPNVAVPNLIGKSRVQALGMLAAAFLGANPQPGNLFVIPSQQVYQQNPAAGTMVPQGTQVMFRYKAP